jgi:hypothetical protein
MLACAPITIAEQASIDSPYAYGIPANLIILTTDQSRNIVAVFKVAIHSPNGKLVGCWQLPDKAQRDGVEDEPCDVAAGPEGDIFVLYTNGDVLRYGPKGNELGLWSYSGIADDTSSDHISIDGEGHVYLSFVKSLSELAVAKYGCDGKLIRRFAPDPGIEELAYLRVDGHGTCNALFRTARGSDEIRKFDPSGTRIASWPVERGEALATDGSGKVFVLSWSDSVVVYSPLGKPSGSWKLPITAGGCDWYGNPAGFAVSQGGSVYVGHYNLAEGALLVRRFNSRGTLLNWWPLR